MQQLVVALDLPTAADALAMSATLAGAVGACKVGSELFTAEGPAIIAALRQRRTRVFLDLKYHDIPNTVASAVREATAHGVWMLTLHTSGGTAMMRAAMDAASETAARLGLPRPIIVGITVLTSLDDEALCSLGLAESARDHVLRLAALAQDAGLDGVVASPREVRALRQRCGRDFVIVTPGIRPAAAGADDQTRTLTAREAIAAGSSYLVVGRPILRAPSPRDAALAIGDEIRSALA